MFTGWITNKGKIIECETYNHLKVDDSIITELWYDKQIDIDEIAEDCSALENSGEHPEWHNYDMAVSEATFKTYQELYGLGFIRLITYNNMIVVEGLKNAIEAHKYVLKKLSDKYGCRLQILEVI